MTGLPVGIKSAVGEQPFWQELATRMEATGGGPDFITIDGGEGGTGAAPLSFADHVALPFKMGFSRVYAPFAHTGLNERIVFIGSAKLGMPHTALFAFALGADMVNVGREAMLAIGCIQAQRCHTGRCPTGVATQNPWLVRGLDPEIKAARAANYVRTLRRELRRADAHLRGVPSVARHPRPARADGGGLPLLHGRGCARLPARVAAHDARAPGRDRAARRRRSARRARLSHNRPRDPTASAPHRRRPRRACSIT